MVASTQPLENFQVTKVGNRLFVPVPWDKADSLRLRLDAAGIQATACFEPAERTAGLEVHQDVDVDKLRAIVSAPQG